MKILACLQHLNMGRSQLHAIDIAGKVMDLGNKVMVYAPAGVLVRMHHILVEDWYSLVPGAKKLTNIFIDLLAYRSNSSRGMRARYLLRSAIEVLRSRSSMKSGASLDREMLSHSGVTL